MNSPLLTFSPPLVGEASVENLEGLLYISYSEGSFCFPQQLKKVEKLEVAERKLKHS